MSFVEWCNLNQGFFSFILSCLSLISSIVAIIISLLAIKNEYKKKLYVSCELHYDNSKKVTINITNIGNKPLGIKNVVVCYDIYHLLSFNDKKEYESKILLPSESIALEYIIDEIINDKIFKTMPKDAEKSFNIYVIDSYGKKHKCNDIYHVI